MGKTVLNPDRTETPIYTVYISGPMRVKGPPDFNYPQFLEAEAQWRLFAQNKGFKTDVNNPARNFNGDTTRPNEEYMQVDIENVLQSDAIVLLPGWEESTGCRLEIDVAKATGKDFWKAEWQKSHTGGKDQMWFYQMSETPTFIETVEQEARRLVFGEKAKVYGHPRGDFDKVAGIWSALLGMKISAEMVAVMMIGFKLARLAATPTHHDSKVDVVGYLLTLERLQENVQES